MSFPTLNYKGFWYSVTNTPSLVDGVGTIGDAYQIVNKDFGTVYNIYNRDLGSGVKSWIANDYIYYDGSEWQLLGTVAGGSGSGSVTSVGFASGTGIGLSGTNPITTSGIINISNTLPDRTVTISGNTGISVLGTYPDFSITNTSPSTPAITTINGLTTPVQVLLSGTTGQDFNIVSSVSGHTFNIPSSSNSNRGLLTPTDWSTFNNKQSALSGSGIVKSIAGAITYVSGTTSQFVKADGSLDSNNYLIGISGVAAGGDLTGTYPNPTIANGAITYPNHQTISNSSLMGNPSGVTAVPQSIKIGSGLIISGTTLQAQTYTPGGSTTQIQYNNNGVFGGASQADIANDGNIQLVSVSGSTVSVPESSNAKIYSNNRTGLDELHIVPSLGVDSILQNSLGQKVSGRMTLNGTTLQTDGFYASAISNAGTASFVLRSYDATNLLPNFMYYKLTTSTGTNLSSEAYYGFTSRANMTGNATYGAGGKLTITYGLPNYASTDRHFAGYAATFGQIGTTTDPSAQLNTVGVGKDSADSTLQFMFNNGSGTATKVNTGITPNTNDVYRVTVYIPSNTTISYITLERFTKTAITVVSANNSGKVISAGTMLYMHCQSNTAATSRITSIGVIHVFEELY